MGYFFRGFASRGSIAESEAKLQLFIDYAPVALAMFDREMRYIAVSRRWLRDYGLEGRDIVGLGHYEVFPEIGENWKAVHRRGLAGETVRAEEDHFVRADGSVQWLRWEVRPWTDGGGRVGGIVIFTEDITRCKRSERDQADLAGTLKALRSISRLVAKEKDPPTILDRACELLAETRGYSSAWSVLLDESGTPRLAGKIGLGAEPEDLERLLAQGGLPPCLLKADEEPGVVAVPEPEPLCRLCPLVANMGGKAALAGAIRREGKTYGYLVAAMPPAAAENPEERAIFAEALEDIALALYAITRDKERTRAEAALRAKAAEATAGRAKLAAALASMNDAVFISDTEGNFIDFNDAFATFHKFRSKEECAKTLAEYPAFLDVYMADGSLAPLEMWAVPRALRGEIGTNETYFHRRKDTGESWVGSYSFAPIRDETGGIAGSVVVGRDITEQKNNEELRIQAFEEKELLLRELFHRTKNNMLTIIAMMSLRAASKPGACLEDFVEAVRRQIMAMALVHEGLYERKDLSRIELREYLVELANYAVSESNAEGRVALALDLEKVSLPFDAVVPLALVVNELLENAVKHGFPGEAKGEIRIGLRRSASGAVEIVIADDGVGMAPDLDPRGPGCFGLGIAYTLVEQQLRGTIERLGGAGTGYRIAFRDDAFEIRL